MANPLVSVIIDNYNYGRFLSEAIDSVLEQTYTNYEVIVVDDGSTDHSREVIEDYCRQYPDKIVPVYKENGGQASAFNAGVSIAQGSIIAFLDSDDYWAKEKLEKVVALHEHYNIVQHNLIKNELPYFSSLENGETIRTFLRQYGSYALVMPTSALSFTYRLLEQFFPIPETETLRICADSYIAGYALYLGDIYSLDECLGVYRVHGANHFCGAGVDYERGRKIILALNIALQEKGLSPVPYFKNQSEALTAGLVNETAIVPGATYLIYGTGSVGQALYHRIVENGGNVRYFSDSNSEKWGLFINQVEIIQPERICNFRHEFHQIVIGSMYIRDILQKLTELGYHSQQDILFPNCMVDQVNNVNSEPD